MRGKNLLEGSPSQHHVEAVARLAEQARRLLLVTHVAPDGDAIGSLLGLGWLLRAQGKDVIMACEDPVPEVYTWLPGSSQIVKQGDGAHDLVISLDCSDRRRMGDVGVGDDDLIPVVNIDHHVTNTLFGILNWVDPTSVATAQMVLHLLDVLGWELPEHVAVCLLTGLVTDTRCFRTPNVDQAALGSALRLMEAGASLSQVTQRVLEQRPLASVRLWGQAINQLQLQDGILWTEVTSSMRQQWSCSEDGDSGLTNFLSGVREAGIVVVFTERDIGTVDVGMRAKPGQDVAQVALRLGGGGHPQAAGCTIKGNLAMAKDQVFAELYRSLSMD